MNLREIQRRHFRCYLGILNQADTLYCEGGEALAKGLELFDDEWPNISLGQEQAARRPDDDKEAAWYCVRYAGYGSSILHVRQHPSEQIRWLESAIKASRSLEDRVTEAIHLGNLGIAHYLLGDSRRAIEFHELNLTIAREIGDRRIEGAALANLGVAYDSLGEYRKAISLYEKHLEITREIGDRAETGKAVCNLGTAYQQIGDCKRSLELCGEALVIARELADLPSECAALGNIGVAHYLLGNYQ